MKVLFWVPYPTEGASNRYRVEQYLSYLKTAQIKCSLRPFWSSCAYKILYKPRHYFKKLFFLIIGTISRILDLIRVMNYDVVFIHREAYPIGGPFFETILSIRRKPFIFDFDDAIFLPASSRTNNFIERFKNPNKVAKIIEMSRYVIAGNHYLLDFALQYNRYVSIIPTPIDTQRYYPEVKKCNDEIVIGWIGSVTTLGFLDSMRDIFIKISKQFSRVKFKIVGGHFFIDSLSNIISKPWSLEEEIEDLRTFDIGIMPMPDNQWTRGKCGFKAILYMSMGIPCVCSPVGVNKEIITDGVNGFLADTKDEWIGKLSLLIENPQLRQRIGLAGRKTVEERYSVKVNVPKFLEILHNVYREKYGSKSHRL
jgi:glycosyltransferase involved in cell wall biosynthesis